MFLFVLTGQGAEGDIRQFLPQHTAHAAMFSGLALATGSALAMPLGAFLMNYMGHYVGALGSASSHPWRAIALAWVPWSLVRIASFVTLGVVLGGPVLARVFQFKYRLTEQRRWILLAAAGLLVDVVLKWALAPSWRLLIKSAAGW
jgi:predicted membrane protein